MKAAEYFSLLEDESRDTSKKEQLSICIRYYFDEVINEVFFNFIKAERLDSESVKAKLLEVLFSYGMDTKLVVVAQCYDGASVMSGIFKGLQQLMRQDPCPRAIYIHCWAHRLNLVVLSCIQVVQKPLNFLTLSAMSTIF